MVKLKNRQTPKKTLADHSEDALYREVWEEVFAQKAYDFVRRNFKYIILGIIVLVLGTAGFVTVKEIKKSNALEVAHGFESAMDMNPALAREALSRLAKKTSGGMGDLALFRAYQFAFAANDRADAMAKLEHLAENAATRDFRDLALIQLAELKGDNMTADEFEKMMAPLMTKRSPFYFTGLLFVAEKYLAENKPEEARPFIKKITSEETAPASISAIAQTLLK